MDLEPVDTDRLREWANVDDIVSEVLRSDLRGAADELDRLRAAVAVLREENAAQARELHLVGGRIERIAAACEWVPDDETG